MSHHHDLTDREWAAIVPTLPTNTRGKKRVCDRKTINGIIIDDTALLKKGAHSVGVAPQYAGCVGKRANCQALVSTTLAQDDVPFPLGLRLFLPQSWTDDPRRMDAARVPQTAQKAMTKPQIALAEIDRIIASGVAFGTVLADAGYGISTAFRAGLSTRGLQWIVGFGANHRAYCADVRLTYPTQSRGRPRKHAIPDQPAQPITDLLDAQQAQQITWRQGTKAPLSARFAARRVRLPTGIRQRQISGSKAGLPGDELWLIGEWRACGTVKYHLSNLPADTPLKTLVAKLKSRWACELAHQQMKQELGLDHYEGRFWQGLHRHTLMVMIAYAYLQIQRRQARSPAKKTPEKAA